MALNDILGQTQALRLLRSALAHGRLAHAYLFAGPPGVGKHFTARQFIKALYCETPEAEGCGTCAPCHKVEAENHPDVIDIGPDGASIRIEQIRGIQQRLSYKPYENQRIAIILDECERLTPPAANALLKTLEEPPAHALILLLTGNKGALPLTINSRCQLVPFRPLSLSDLRVIFEQQGVESETAAIAAMLSQGGGRYTQPSEITEALAARGQAQALITEVVQGQAIDVFVQARKLAGKRKQCETLLYWVALLCRDLVTLSVAPERPLYNDDLRGELEALARHVAVDPLLDAFQTVEELQRYVSMNLNPQLVFERLIMQLQHLAVPTPVSP